MVYSFVKNTSSLPCFIHQGVPRLAVALLIWKYIGLLSLLLVPWFNFLTCFVGQAQPFSLVASGHNLLLTFLCCLRTWQGSSMA